MTGILVKNPAIATEARNILNRLMLELKAASQGKVVIMRQEQLEGIITVLNAIGSEASPELKQSIQKIKQDIRQKKILSRAGIKINR